MSPAPLGKTGLLVSPLAFGAFKIGRNEGIKYPADYELPADTAVETLLNAVLDLGINYIDTAPAYGLSEERIGRFLAHRRGEFVLSTKVGETFVEGQSVYDFSGKAVRQSVERSLSRLQTDVLDVVFVHSNGDDLWILQSTDCVPTLLDLKQAGKIRAIGFSGKTVEGAQTASATVDVLMVEYHIDDRTHETVIQEAAGQGVGIVVKKGLASGHLPAADAIGFVLQNPQVGAMIVGSLNESHIRDNLMTANRMRS